MEKEKIWTVLVSGAISRGGLSYGVVAICNFKPSRKVNGDCASELPRILLSKLVVESIMVADPVLFVGPWTRLGSARCNKLSREYVGRVAKSGERWVLYGDDQGRWLAIDWRYAAEAQ